MRIDEDTVRSLATQVDPEKADSLAELFLLLLDQEHSARHQSKPRLVKKFTDSIDDERSDL